MQPLQEEAAGRLGLIASAVAAGLAAQTVQVVCLREILQTARGGEVVLGLAFASWFVGTSLGAATWRGRPLTAALLAVAVPALLLPALRLMPPSPGGWAPAAALLAAVGAYAPGAFFAAVLRRLDVRGALVAEAVGACAAGALLTFLLFQVLPAWTLLLLAGLVVVGTWIGSCLLEHVDERFFVLLYKSVLTAIAAYLIACQIAL